MTARMGWRLLGALVAAHRMGDLPQAPTPPPWHHQGCGDGARPLRGQGGVVRKEGGDAMDNAGFIGIRVFGGCDGALGSIVGSGLWHLGGLMVVHWGVLLGVGNRWREKWAMQQTKCLVGPQHWGVGRPRDGQCSHGLHWPCIGHVLDKSWWRGEVVDGLGNGKIRL
jgi:hypothetical protein